MGKQTQRILGIDPGTRLCGWGFVDCDGSQITHVDNGVVVLSAKDELYSRLGNLLEQLNALIEKYQPTSVAVEGVFQHRNARSALSWVTHGASLWPLQPNMDSLSMNMQRAK